jgi:hypothetical protein
MRVEADLFSGRANPAWHLDTAEEEQLADLFRELPAAEAEKEEDEGLGYRGLRVTGLAGCESVRVARGQVSARGEGGAREYLDPDRRLERWLVETAAGRIDPGVLDLLRAEVGG